MLATDPEDPVTRPGRAHPRARPRTDDVGQAAAHPARPARLAQRARRRRALDRPLPSDTAVWMHS